MNKRLCKQCLELKAFECFAKSGEGKFKRCCKLCTRNPKTCNLDIFEVRILEQYLVKEDIPNFDSTLIDHTLNKLCTSCHVIKLNCDFRSRMAKDKVSRYDSHVCKQCESGYSLQYNQEHEQTKQEYQKARTLSGLDAIMRKSRAEEHLQDFLYRKAKQNAKQRNREFNLDASDILIPKLCPFLKIPLQVNIGTGGKQDNSYSIDRIDSTKGYIKGNVQVLSSLANTMKNSATAAQLLTFARSIIEIYKDEDIV